MSEKTARIYVAGSIFDKPLQDSYAFIKDCLLYTSDAADD